MILFYCLGTLNAVIMLNNHDFSVNEMIVIIIIFGFQ